MSIENRKLAAIVFTDICGFTELMFKDEKKAMAILERQKVLLKPIINNFNGELLKEIGDGENSYYLSNIPLGLFNLIFINPL